MLSVPLDALEVGARAISPGRTITEADVVGFAALTGDRHPQHTDAAWAAESAFGERIAHGMLILSYAAGLVAFDPDHVVALRRVRDAVFKRPVHLGDTIGVETRVAAVDPATGVVTCAWLIRNQHDRVVVRATVDVLWRREPDVTAPAADDELAPVEASGMIHAFSSLPL